MGEITDPNLKAPQELEIELSGDELEAKEGLEKPSEAEKIINKKIDAELKDFTPEPIQERVWFLQDNKEFSLALKRAFRYIQSIPHLETFESVPDLITELTERLENNKDVPEVFILGSLEDPSSPYSRASWIDYGLREMILMLKTEYERRKYHPPVMAFTDFSPASAADPRRRKLSEVAEEIGKITGVPAIHNFIRLPFSLTNLRELIDIQRSALIEAIEVQTRTILKVKESEKIGEEIGEQISDYYKEISEQGAELLEGGVTPEQITSELRKKYPALFSRKLTIEGHEVEIGNTKLDNLLRARKNETAYLTEIRHTDMNRRDYLCNQEMVTGLSIQEMQNLIDQKPEFRGLEVVGRTKTLESIERKIEDRRRKNPAYDFTDITDLTGLRIPTPDLETMQNLVLYLEKELADRIIEKKNYMDGSKENNQSYYRGIHYLILTDQGHPQRCFELQLKTPILQIIADIARPLDRYPELILTATQKMKTTLRNLNLMTLAELEKHLH